MNQYKLHKALKFQNNTFQNVEDLLVLEESLLINVNFKPFTLTMRTPDNEEELVRGLLFTENILNKSVPYKYTIVEKKNGIITSVNVDIDEVNLPKEIYDKRNLLSVSSCGICGKIEKNEFLNHKKSIQTEIKLNPLAVLKLLNQMKTEQTLFNQTGGCHGVAAFSENLELLSIQEDIGRHNATDKVIGNLLLNNNLSKAKIIVVSGRVSYEIVSKVFMAQIPFLIAVSSPSSLAVELAEELGITLLAFSRDDRFTCYSNKENLSLSN